MVLRPTLIMRTSEHEACHVVVAILHRQSIVLATVEHHDGALGRVVFHAPRSRSLVVDVRQTKQVEAMMTILLAGFAGEMILDRETDPQGCTQDILRAWDLGQAAGKDEQFFVRIMGRAVRILEAVWPCVLSVAAELRRYGTLDGAALRRFVQRELGLRRRGRGTLQRRPALP